MTCMRRQYGTTLPFVLRWRPKRLFGFDGTAGDDPRCPTGLVSLGVCGLSPATAAGMPAAVRSKLQGAGAWSPPTGVATGAYRCADGAGSDGSSIGQVQESGSQGGPAERSPLIPGFARPFPASPSPGHAPANRIHEKGPGPCGPGPRLGRHVDGETRLEVTAK